MIKLDLSSHNSLINLQQYTTIYKKGSFFLELGPEGIDRGSHFCVQIETVPETCPTIRKRFLAMSSHIKQRSSRQFMHFLLGSFDFLCFISRFNRDKMVHSTGIAFGKQRICFVEFSKFKEKKHRESMEAGLSKHSLNPKRYS